MDDKITLDRKTFKALAQDTRIAILKELEKRRKTQSELAKSLAMSVSTIKEHLDNLESVDLVKQIDEGYKWKYYELTKKGKKIITPSETKIWISLALTILALAAALNSFITKLASISFKGAPQYSSAAKEAGRNVLEDTAQELVSAPPHAEALDYTQHIPIPYTDLLLVIAIAILAGILIGCLIKSGLSRKL